MKSKKNLKIALLALFCASAMAISYLESLIPPIIAVPGVKPGFSNIVTMFCVSSLGTPYGLAIVLFKAFFALLTRGATAFLMSLSGGLLSLLVMAIIFKFFKNTFGYIGIGILCALFHNIGQLAVAVVILGEAMLTLTPLLLLTGLVAGIVTGAVFKYTLPVLNKALNHSQGVDKND